MSIGTSIGDWLGSFMAALLSIPVAGALQVIARDCGRPRRGGNHSAASCPPTRSPQSVTEGGRRTRISSLRYSPEQYHESHHRLYCREIVG
jgi:hypothetical protein